MNIEWENSSITNQAEIITFTHALNTISSERVQRHSRHRVTILSKYPTNLP